MTPWLLIRYWPPDHLVATRRLWCVGRAELWNCVGVRLFKRTRCAKIFVGADVVGVEADDGIEFRHGQVRPFFFSNVRLPAGCASGSAVCHRIACSTGWQAQLNRFLLRFRAGGLALIPFLRLEIVVNGAQLIFHVFVFFVCLKFLFCFFGTSGQPVHRA